MYFYHFYCCLLNLENWFQRTLTSNQICIEIRIEQWISLKICFKTESRHSRANKKKREQNVRALRCDYVFVSAGKYKYHRQIKTRNRWLQLYSPVDLINFIPLYLTPRHHKRRFSYNTLRMHWNFTLRSTLLTSYLFTLPRHHKRRFSYNTLRMHWNFTLRSTLWTSYLFTSHPVTTKHASLTILLECIETLLSGRPYELHTSLPYPVTTKDASLTILLECIETLLSGRPYELHTSSPHTPSPQKTLLLQYS